MPQIFFLNEGRTRGLRSVQVHPDRAGGERRGRGKSRRGGRADVSGAHPNRKPNPNRAGPAGRRAGAGAPHAPRTRCGFGTEHRCVRAPRHRVSTAAKKGDTRRRRDRAPYLVPRACGAPGVWRAGLWFGPRRAGRGVWPLVPVCGQGQGHRLGSHFGNPAWDQRLLTSGHQVC